MIEEILESNDMFVIKRVTIPVYADLPTTELESKLSIYVLQGMGNLSYESPNGNMEAYRLSPDVFCSIQPHKKYKIFPTTDLTLLLIFANGEANIEEY